MKGNASGPAIVLAVALCACGSEPQSPAGEVSDLSSSRPSAEAADAAGVTFDVELVGGAAEGSYQVSSSNRCMAVVGDDGQLNVNAFDPGSALNYGQLSVYGFDLGDGGSDSFIFIAKTASYELRIDTVPGSLIGNAGTGAVAWRIDGRREIVFDVEGAGDDGVAVRATVTCNAPSWTGI